MKKAVLLSILLGLIANTARAQSSVTLFGVVDTNITHITADGIPNSSRTFMDNSGISASRIGFTGVEDLGGGLKAGFWLEAALSASSGLGGATNTNNTPSGATSPGGLAFNRRATVSLISDRFGELRMGRDLDPIFWNATYGDPFGYNGIAEIASFLFSAQGVMGPTAARASNSIQYITPGTLHGFFVNAMYALGGNVSSDTTSGFDGNYSGVWAGYKQGPLYVAFATSFTHQTASVTKSPLQLGMGGVHATNFAMYYDAGRFKPMVFLQQSTMNALPEKMTTQVASVGLSVRVGFGEFRLLYDYVRGRDYFAGSHAQGFNAGYTYNLSKRTAVYATYARINNSGNYAFSLEGGSPVPALGHDVSGVSFGIRHSF
jgi:predicted porin